MKDKEKQARALIKSVKNAKLRSKLKHQLKELMGETKPPSNYSSSPVFVDSYKRRGIYYNK